MAATNKQRTQRVLREIRQRYSEAPYLNDRELFVVPMSWIGSYRYPVISWEAGPQGWAVDICYRLNEKFREEHVDIFVEPQTSYALAVFKS
jgi:hypothetical protein